jgi:general secretion pathway protein I
MNRSRAFTLIEVLVALAIAGMGLAAVLGVVTHAARNASYLHDKTFASWIALNQITKLRLASTLPSVDRTDGDLDYANGKWKWRQVVTQTDIPGIRRVDVAVRHDGDAAESPIATVTGFVGRTQVSGVQAVDSWDYAGASGGAATLTGAGSTAPGSSPSLLSPAPPAPAAQPSPATPTVTPTTPDDGGSQ